jgi:hypothetical protein
MREDALVVIWNRHRAEIKSVEDWGRLAAPAAVEHWKDGRSAKELAKAWIEGAGLRSLSELFESLDDTRDFQVEEAVAEAQIAFDDFPGGKRNHDLLIRGRCAAGPIVIGLEAKADETFGQTIATYRRDALAARTAGKTTNAPERLENLLQDIGNISLSRNPGFGDLRYQLFSGVAGTLAAAQEGQVAAFVVHEFATEMTTEKKRVMNGTALAEFVGDVTGAVAPEEDWWLLGPFHAQAERWSKIPYYIGHLTTPGTNA